MFCFSVPVDLVLHLCSHTSASFLQRSLLMHRSGSTWSGHTNARKLMHEQEWVTQELLQHLMEIMCVVRAGIYVDLVCAGRYTRVQNSCLYMCPARCCEDLDINRWCKAAWISCVQLQVSSTDHSPIYRSYDWKIKLYEFVYNAQPEISSCSSTWWSIRTHSHLELSLVKICRPGLSIDQHSLRKCTYHMDVFVYSNCAQICYRSLIPLVFCDTADQDASQDDFHSRLLDLGTREAASGGVGLRNSTGL
jgi:hypothetical protein